MHRKVRNAQVISKPKSLSEKEGEELIGPAKDNPLLLLATNGGIWMPLVMAIAYQESWLTIVIYLTSYVFPFAFLALLKPLSKRIRHFSFGIRFLFLFLYGVMAMSPLLILPWTVIESVFLKYLVSTLCTFSCFRFLHLVLERDTFLSFSPVLLGSYVLCYVDIFELTPFTKPFKGLFTMRAFFHLLQFLYYCLFLLISDSFFQGMSWIKSYFYHIGPFSVQFSNPNTFVLSALSTVLILLAGGFRLYYSSRVLDAFMNLFPYFVGYRIPVTYNHPALAISASDFWSRWNLNVQRELSSIFYRPLVHVHHRILGLIATFLASSFLHGYPMLAAHISVPNTLLESAFFLVQVPFILVEKMSGLKGRAWFYFIVACTFPISIIATVPLFEVSGIQPPMVTLLQSILI